jgi:hypothetical protein
MRTPRLSRLGALLALVAQATACRTDTPREVLGEGITRERRGDTIVIRTSTPGAWGPLQDAVEVLRVPADSPETTLGRVYVIAATPDGGVILRDEKGPTGAIIRQFDSAGKFVRNIGREGSGPGEYQPNSVAAFAFLADGTILLRDGGRVVLQFAPDGTFLRSFLLGHPSATSWEVYGASDGTVLVRGSVPRGLRLEQMRSYMPPIVRHTITGDILDSIAPKARWLATDPVEETDPREVWFPLPDGRLVHSRTDKFGFVLSDPSGATPPVMAEVDAPAVPVLDDEHRELSALAAWRAQHSTAERPTQTKVPRTKPPVRGWAFADLAGRIWIQRSTVAVRVPPRVVAMAGTRSISAIYAEPWVFAVFEQDGTYLGDVRFPVGARLTVGGSTAWAIVEDSSGVPELVKYRVGR